MRGGLIMQETQTEEWVAVFCSQQIQRVRLVADMLSASGLRAFVSYSAYVDKRKAGASVTRKVGSSEEVPTIRVPVSQETKARELLFGYGLTN